MQTFDSSYFIGKSHFEEDGTQNYLVFQSNHRYLKRVSRVGSGNYIYFWTSRELSDENITAPTTPDYKRHPELKGSCLKQDKVTYDHRKIENTYIVYEISRNINIRD